VHGKVARPKSLSEPLSSHLGSEIAIFDQSQLLISVIHRLALVPECLSYIHWL
jgi:hypothetical protein